MLSSPIKYLNHNTFKFHINLGGIFKTLSLLLCTSALLLTGCTQNSETSSVFSSWDDNYARLEKLVFYKSAGRLGIFTTQNRLGASYELEGISGGFIFSIKSPVGNNLATATVTDNTLSFNIGGKTYKDDYAVAVFEEAFGVEIPADKLQHILLGMPQGKVEKDTSGRIISSTWDGYKISYKGEVHEQGLVLPQNIEVQKNDYRVRITISSFELKQDRP